MGKTSDRGQNQKCVFLSLSSTVFVPRSIDTYLKKNTTQIYIKKWLNTFLKQLLAVVSNKHNSNRGKYCRAVCVVLSENK